jgi:vacuolar-type H+-ATPase subunit H
MSIEDIRDMVKRERALEEEQKEAERKAAETINAAKEKAAKMLEEISNEGCYKDVLARKLEEIEEKKNLVVKEADKRIKLLQEIAAKNRERTISFIIELVREK